MSLFQTKTIQVYTKFNVYPQAKQFIDEKLVLKRKKSIFFSQNIFVQRDKEAVNNLNH